MSDAPLFVIADANIFLEYERIDDARWRVLFGNRPLTFELSVHTVTELDEKRDSPKLRLRRRARKLTAWLLAQQESGAPFKSGAELHFIAGTPVEFLERGDLDRRNPDDVLVACGLQYQMDHPERELAVLSEDTGVVLKARGFGLQALRPPAELRLPADPSEEERELEELRKENERLQLGHPLLVLRGDETPVRVSVNAVAEDLDSYVQGRVAEAQATLHPQATSNQLEQVDAYLKELERHLRETYDQSMQLQRTFALNFFLDNTGRGPATDIDVFIHTPAEVRLAIELPEIQDSPEPPRLGPLTVFDLMRTPLLGAAVRTLDLPFGRGLVEQMRHPVGDWRLNGEGGAAISVTRLKHGMHWKLPRLFAFFTGEPVNFHLTWSVHIDNAPVPFEGEVHFTADETRDENGLLDLFRDPDADA